MIIFTNIDPMYFVNNSHRFIGSIREVVTYNFTSMNCNFQNLNGLLPNSMYMSNEAIQQDESQLFELEYFRYLDSNIPFIQLMALLIPEYEKSSSRLTVILVDRSPYRDSIMFSLQKYLFSRYGVQSTVFESEDDWFNLKPATFSVQGLARMDSNIVFIDSNRPQSEEF